MGISTGPKDRIIGMGMGMGTGMQFCIQVRLGTGMDTGPGGPIEYESDVHVPTGERK